MKLTLQRTHAIGPRTFGKLFADGRFLCYALEDEVREIEGQPVAAWKIAGATAIPSGTYRIALEWSPRFGPDTLTVHEVPGFVGVRMHAGNSENDTEGCPLLGAAINAGGIVGGTSRQAVQLVRDVVRQALQDGEAVTMDVSNIVVTA
jgi:hypothetical protein